MNERFKKFNHPRTEEIVNSGFEISGPEDTLRNQEMFAEPVLDKIEEITDGVIFEQKNIVLDDIGSYTNSYRVVCRENAPNIIYDIETTEKPVHLKRWLVNDSDTICAINGGFFLLVDEKPETIPVEMSLGTIIRNGILRGVQSHDRPVLWMNEEGYLNVNEINSHGQVNIGNKTHSWTGINSNLIHENEADTYLFSSDCCIVEHDYSEQTGTIRTINREKSITPIHGDKVDLVCKINGDYFIVAEINEGGGTFVIDGDFILQGHKSEFNHVKIGDQVDINYSDLDIKTINNAITIGPSIFDFENEKEHPINNDKSLGEKPPFVEERMARSVIYKTNAGELIFELFDGAPKTELFKGISPKEVYNFLTEENADIEWGYFLDPGQSARLAVRHSDGSVVGYGNQHYIRWPKSSDQPFIWSGEHGRSIPSAVTIKCKST